MANHLQSQYQLHSKLAENSLQSKYNHVPHFKQSTINKPLPVIVPRSKGPIYTHYTVRKPHDTRKSNRYRTISSTPNKASTFHTNPSFQSSETWTITETKSISTSFSPKKSSIRKYSNKRLPSLTIKPPAISAMDLVQKHTKHQLNVSLTVSESCCDIEEFVGCLERMSTKSSLYSKASDINHIPDHTSNTLIYKPNINQIADKKHKQHAYNQRSYVQCSGVTADELLRLISFGEVSDTETEIDPQHVSEPHPHHIPCASDVSHATNLTNITLLSVDTNTLCEAKKNHSTTVIPSILTMSPDTDAKNTPIIGLSLSASQNGDTLVYNVISYSVTDESTDNEDDSTDEAWKLSQTLTALHHNINSVALCDIKQ